MMLLSGINSGYSLFSYMTTTQEFVSSSPNFCILSDNESGVRVEFGLAQAIGLRLVLYLIPNVRVRVVTSTRVRECVLGLGGSRTWRVDKRYPERVDHTAL